MKELEDYVLEKKQANKYLDDISDIETASTGAHIKKQERKSRKQKNESKEPMASQALNKSGQGLI